MSTVLANLFGVDPRRTVDPMQAVAIGAAVQAGILGGEIKGVRVMQAWQAQLLRMPVQKLGQMQGGTRDEAGDDTTSGGEGIDVSSTLYLKPDGNIDAAPGGEAGLSSAISGALDRSAAEIQGGGEGEAFWEDDEEAAAVAAFMAELEARSDDES